MLTCGYTSTLSKSKLHISYLELKVVFLALNRSTEMALLKIQNDIASSMDKGAAVGLVLLELSAAFDTIDHSILFNCLQHCYGIGGVVLKWVQSFLSSRKQETKIDIHLLNAFQLPYGVPQGSVLGPLLFTLYATPLSLVISKFNVTHTYMQMTYKFTWNLTLGTSILVSLNRQIALRLSTLGLEKINLN